MRWRAVVVATSVALVVAGCGGGDEEPTATASPTALPSPTASATPTDDESPTPTDEPSPTDTAAPTGSDDPTALPGDPWDGFAQAGDVLAVVGVAHDDALNVRAIPGMDGAVLTTVGPTDDDLVATGEARQLSQSFWYQVEVDGVTGWASVRFLAFLGGTDDATAAFLDGRDPIRAETMQQLGEEVAAGFASTEPASEIVMSVAPTVGDLGEVTHDVIGIGDDAVRGFRLHVFGTPDEGGEGFVLRTIERTLICDRGSDGELCL